jgi:hypothetical protein
VAEVDEMKIRMGKYDIKGKSHPEWVSGSHPRHWADINDLYPVFPIDTPYLNPYLGVFGSWMENNWFSCGENAPFYFGYH